MNGARVGWLALLACLQLAGIAMLYWPGNGMAPDAADRETALLSARRDAPASIEITDANGSSVALLRHEQQWIIGDTALPAAVARVDRLLEALSRPTGFPVARSDSARERFDVDDAMFQRRIIVQYDAQGTPSEGADDSPRTTVYLGTSPGMRRVHARRDDSDSIHTLTLSTFDVPATVDGWLDPTLLSMEGMDAVAIAGRQWITQDGAWVPAAQGTAGHPVPAAALEALAQRLRSLQVTGVAAAENGNPAGEAVTEMTLGNGARRVTLRLAQGDDSSDAHLYSSEYDRWFTLSGYDRDRLTDAVAALTAAPDDAVLDDGAPDRATGNPDRLSDT